MTYSSTPGLPQSRRNRFFCQSESVSYCNFPMSGGEEELNEESRLMGCTTPSADDVSIHKGGRCCWVLRAFLMLIIFPLFYPVWNKTSMDACFLERLILLPTLISPSQVYLLIGLFSALGIRLCKGYASGRVFIGEGSSGSGCHPSFSPKEGL